MRAMKSGDWRIVAQKKKEIPHCRLHCATVVIYNGHNWIPKQAHNHFPQRYGTWQWPSFSHWHHDPLKRLIQ